MEIEEREEIILRLQEELQGFFSWIMEELGLEYYIEEPEQASSSLEKDAEEKIHRRAESERVHLWERDWYAFVHHKKHPSVYKLLEAKDLEILHYLEDLDCGHMKGMAIREDPEGEPGNWERVYEQTFGVLLASQTLGWMYRMDFCEVCGLVEVWSMEYNPGEIARYASEMC